MSCMVPFSLTLWDLFGLDWGVPDAFRAVLHDEQDE